MSSLVFRLCENAPALLKDVLLECGWKEFQEGWDGDWNLWWKSCGFRACDFDHCKPWQRLNHFPKSGLITRKDSLARNLRRMRGVYGSSAYNFSPLAFILPNDYTKFVGEYSKQTKSDQKRFWICKPVDQSRGRGIFIFKDLKELTYDCATVVQKYITNPFLVSGYKFDLRLYVVVESFNPLAIYIYHEGLVRFGTQKFDLTDTGNIFSHLTNTSINKLSPSYSSEKERVGSGCKWSLSQLRTYFHQHDVDDSLLWHKINALIILTLLTQAPEVPNNCPNCFELFGFDVLIDDNLKPWLLEVNFSPSLGYDCPLDATIKKPMLTDIVELLSLREVDACKVVNSRPSGKRVCANVDRQGMHFRPSRNVTSGRRSRNSQLGERINAESDNDSNPPHPEAEADTDLDTSSSKSLLDISNLNYNIPKFSATGNMMSKSHSMDMLQVSSGNYGNDRLPSSGQDFDNTQSCDDDYARVNDVQINRPRSTPESCQLRQTERHASQEFVKAFQSKQSASLKKPSRDMNNGAVSEKETLSTTKKHAEKGLGLVPKISSRKLGKTRHPSLEQISSAKYSHSPRLLRRKISLPPKLRGSDIATLPGKCPSRPLSRNSRRIGNSNNQLEISEDDNCPETTRVLARSYVNVVNSSNRFVKKPITQAGNYILAFPFNDVTARASKGLINTKACVDEIKKAIKKVSEANKKTTKCKTSIHGHDSSTLDLSKPFWGFRPLYNFGMKV